MTVWFIVDRVHIRVSKQFVTQNAQIINGVMQFKCCVLCHFPVPHSKMKQQ